MSQWLFHDKWLISGLQSHSKINGNELLPCLEQVKWATLLHLWNDVNLMHYVLWNHDRNLLNFEYHKTIRKVVRCHSGGCCISKIEGGTKSIQSIPFPGISNPVFYSSRPRMHLLLLPVPLCSYYLNILIPQLALLTTLLLLKSLILPKKGAS